MNKLNSWNEVWIALRAGQPVYWTNDAYQVISLEGYETIESPVSVNGYELNVKCLFNNSIHSLDETELTDLFTK